MFPNSAWQIIKESNDANSRLSTLAAKGARKMVDPFYYSRKFPTPLYHALPTFIFTRDRSDQKWNIAAASGMELHNLPIPALTEFNNVWAALCVMNYFPLTILAFPQPYCRKHIGNLSLWTGKVFWYPTSSDYAMYTWSKHHIPLVRMSFHLDIFFQRAAVLRDRLRVNTS